jgi:voltage-gated potassium channel
MPKKWMRKWWKKFLKEFSAFSMPVILGAFSVFWIFIAALEFWIESSVDGSNIKTFEDGLWWGVVTFLTIGYGDRYPVTMLGRSVAVLLMFGGVLVISLLTARISTMFFEAALRKRRGDVDTEVLNDHFIICGHTEDLEELLGHVMDMNPTLTGEKIVVISQVSESAKDNILSQPRFKEIGFVIGEYYTENHLRRASPERARKVLILADRTPGPSGQTPTMVEIDARTIMTAMSLSKIARGTMVVAEILDPKMDQYLKIAGVSEIIYSREYSRLLLGNASGGTGIVNILFDLVDPNTPSMIATHPLRNEWVGQSYSVVKKSFEAQMQGASVVGILENYGNQQMIKETALRKAQKTPDINKLVSNLKSVRDIKCNHPKFNPGLDYILQEGSLIIVIENRMRSQQYESENIAA